MATLHFECRGLFRFADSIVQSGDAMVQSERASENLGQQWSAMDTPTRRELYNLMQQTEMAILDKNRSLKMAGISMMLLVLVLAVAAIWFWPSGVPETTASDRMVEMAKWTIGTVLTLAALLIGYSWFSAERAQIQYRSDLEREARLVRVQIEQDAAKSIEGITKSSEAKIASLVESIGQFQEQWERARLEMHDSITDAMNSLLSDHVAHYDEQLVEIKGEMKKRDKNMAKGIELLYEDVQNRDKRHIHELSNLQYDLSGITGDINMMVDAKIKGIPSIPQGEMSTTQQFLRFEQFVEDLDGALTGFGPYKVAGLRDRTIEELEEFAKHLPSPLTRRSSQILAIAAKLRERISESSS